MRRPQANVALNEEELDVVSAIAFLEERSISDVLRPVVSDFLRAQAALPEVATAVDALRRRREQRADQPTEKSQSRKPLTRRTSTQEDPGAL